MLKPILENPQFRRRDPLKVILPYFSTMVALPLIITRFIAGNFETSLFERQAHFQTERLVSSPVFEHLRGNLLVPKNKDFI